MVRHLLEQFTDIFEILDTFNGENFFNHRRGTWMFYPHKGNVRIAIDKWREFADLWRQRRSYMQRWCDDYLAANRAAIFARYWTDVGAEAMTKYLESSTNFITPLPTMCSEFSDEWNDAIRITQQIHERKPIERCDDAAILAIHEGQACDDNGWFCNLCEDMEYRWHRELQAEARAFDNVFLNPSSRKRFCATFNGPVSDAWTGPTKEFTPITHASINGKTPFQAMKAFLDATASIRFTLKDRSYVPRSEYDDFYTIWTALDFIDTQLPIDEARITEIEAQL